MKKLLGALLLIINVCSSIAAMEFDLEEAQRTMSHGIKTYDFSKFKEGYNTIKEAYTYYRLNISAPYYDDIKFMDILNTLKPVMFELNRKYDQVHQPDYTPESYRSRQHAKKQIGQALKVIGLYFIPMTLPIFQELDPSFSLQLVAGTILINCGHTLECRSNNKERNAELLVRYRQKAIEDMHLYFLKENKPCDG